MSFDQAMGSIVGNTVGALIGNQFEKEARHDLRQDSETAYLRQKEFAQHGIQWRVEDAKSAGIHPVFALSGGGAAYAPSAVSVNDYGVGQSMAQMGQDVGRAIRAQETPEQRRSRELQETVALSQAARNNAEADMFRSVTIRNYGGNLGSPGMPSNDPNVMATGGTTVPVDSAAGRVEVKPSEVTSYAPDAPWLAAGKSVMWKKYKIGKDREWLLPDSNDAGEALEAMSESLPLQWLVLRENMKANPYFFDENKHLLPDWFTSTGEFLGMGAGALENAIRKQDWSYLPRLWQQFQRGRNYVERSGRDRGINWKGR